jgi:hypothetical protein
MFYHLTTIKILIIKKIYINGQSNKQVDTRIHGLLFFFFAERVLSQAEESERRKRAFTKANTLGSQAAADITRTDRNQAENLFLVGSGRV